MTDDVTLRAPAKINWTLEVLGKRDDGYHEVRTIYQTIALFDTVTVSPAEGLLLSLAGDPGPLADEPQRENLALRAAEQLRAASGTRQGVHMQIEKRIPIAAGLGGGSSDAAAALRGLRTLWRLPLADEELAALGAALGSDAPFLLHGGTAQGAGRGDELTALPDVADQRLVLAWPDSTIADKTARMYGALRPEHYSDGAATERLAGGIRSGRVPTDEQVTNIFERVLREVDLEAGQAFADAHTFGQPHLCGAGPAFFFLLRPQEPADPILRGLQRLGLQALETRTISADEVQQGR